VSGEDWLQLNFLMLTAKNVIYIKQLILATVKKTQRLLKTIIEADSNTINSDVATTN